MGPETLEHGVTSKAVDVYSFGVLLWQMLASSRCEHTCRALRSFVVEANCQLHDACASHRQEYMFTCWCLNHGSLQVPNSSSDQS